MAQKTSLVGKIILRCTTTLPDMMLPTYHRTHKTETLTWKFFLLWCLLGIQHVVETSSLEFSCVRLFWRHLCPLRPHNTSISSEQNNLKKIPKHGCSVFKSQNEMHHEHMHQLGLHTLCSPNSGIASLVAFTLLHSLSPSLSTGENVILNENVSHLILSIKETCTHFSFLFIVSTQNVTCCDCANLCMQTGKQYIKIIKDCEITN